MKFFIVFVTLFALALAAPPRSSDKVDILRQNSDVGAEAFKFDFATSDGAAHQAEGVLQRLGPESEALAVRGSFKFVAPDGAEYQVNYVADENGFQPQGAHLPVAPQA